MTLLKNLIVASIKKHSNFWFSSFSPTVHNVKPECLEAYNSLEWVCSLHYSSVELHFPSLVYLSYLTVQIKSCLEHIMTAGVWCAGKSNSPINTMGLQFHLIMSELHFNWERTAVVGRTSLGIIIVVGWLKIFISASLVPSSWSSWWSNCL